jgi:uncharacterized repeat protein (TIGR01451 family)
MHLRRPSWRLPRTVSAALALSTLSTAVTGLAGVGAAFAAPSTAAPARPDLVVEVSVNPAEVNPAGGIVQVAIVVRNAGSAPANDVKVKVRPPAGTTLAPPPEPGAAALASAQDETYQGWVCHYGDWRCTYGTLAANSEAEVLTLRLRLPAGVIGDTTTLSAAANAAPTPARPVTAVDSVDRASAALTVRGSRQVGRRRCIETSHHSGRAVPRMACVAGDGRRA